MDEVEVETVADPDLTDPVLIEGLPGVGNVGKLAAEHLIEEFESEPVRRVHSEHFPPQVAVDEGGLATLADAEFYAVDAGRDLLVLAGDHQAAGDSPVGHYRLTEAFLDVAESFGVAEIIALGGVPTGELVEDHAVIGAATDAELRDRYADVGVEFRSSEPEGGIVGTSGLLLGLGARRDLSAACLMGETSGYIVDPKSAQAVLETIRTVLDIEIDFARLEERAEEMEEVVSELQEQQASQGQGGSQSPTTAGDDDLRYIG